MSKERINDLLLGLLVVLAQVLLFRYLVLFGAYIDFVFLYILLMMSIRSRTEALIFAFTMGFIVDFFMDSWGLHMMAKTLTVFIAYYLIPRESDSKLDSWQVFLIILGLGLLHNFLFAGLAQFSDVLKVSSFTTIWLGNSLYTAVFGSFLYLFKTN